MSIRLAKVVSFLFTALTVTGQVPSKKIEVHWTRQVFKETKPHGRTLVLAVDIPDQPTLHQRTVFRQSFSRSEKAEMLAALRRYKRPALFANRVTGEDEISNNPIWPMDRAWSARDEAAYNVWIHQNAKPDMLVGAGVTVDCADFAMTLRWIYAHDHHLPAGNSLAGSGALFGSWQSTPDWDKLPADPDWRKDERFKAALRYILKNSYTHSLMNDLYPVAISQDFVLPGTIYLTLFQASGHTRTIFNIGPGDLCGYDSSSCIQIIFGNEPASEEGYVDQLVPWKLAANEGGFLRHRWPEQKDGVWALRDATVMPGHSVEQYGWTDDEYAHNVFVRLGLSASAESQFVTVGTAIGKALTDRLSTTERGYFMCSVVPCKNGDDDYNQWSTPQRDHTLEKQIGSFQRMASRTNMKDPAVVAFVNTHNDWMFDGAPYQMIDIMTKSLFASFGSDPRSDFFTRWGVGDPMILENKLRGLAQVAFDNWMWREELVTASLESSRLDQAFRAFRTQFTSQLSAAPATVQKTLRDTLTGYVTSEKFCAANPNSACTMYDFLIADPSHIDRMSSDASATPTQRWGL
jgi:hypothetical protein